MEYTNYLIPNDTGGCMFWRGLMAVETIWSLNGDVNINNIVSQRPVFDPKYYQGVNMIMVQRLTNEHQQKLLEGFLKPVADATGCWTVFNIDDIMDHRYIPLYNRGRRGYFKEETQKRIKSMLNASDFILTTTDIIKQHYHDLYGVPLENIITIPNLLPHWWAGNFYNKEQSIEKFNRFKKKPRVGIISSLSHYNVEKIRVDNRFNDGYNHGIYPWEEKDENGNKVTVWKDEKMEKVNPDDFEIAKDDLSLFLKTVLRTIDEIQWVFVGYAPQELEEYIKEGKIEYHPGIPIINYPSIVNSFQLNAVVAPCLPGLFNESKSNIKLLECAALGIPLFASDILAYKKYVPENQLFSTDDDLYEKLMKLKKTSSFVYGETIERQWKYINTPHVEAGCQLKNYWLEDNLGLWIKLFSMRNKSQTISFSNYLLAKKNEEAKNRMDVVLDKNNGDLLITKALKTGK